MSLIKPQFLIGAAASGSGKTTFTMGLLRVLNRKGMSVQPFKCGPDYIDGKFHAIAAGRESVNLDSWMASKDHICEVYSNYAKNASVCVVEGVMGLFDGYDKMSGSSAEIAGLLNLPVVVVLNARSSAYTVAAILYGLKHFASGINVVGVVFNQVASPSHYSYLKDACYDVGIADLGYLPKVPDIEIPSRHLGLTIGKENEIDVLSDKVADIIEQYVNVERLLEITTSCHKINNHLPIYSDDNLKKSNRPRIAIAQDAAFNFIYKENIDVLSRRGDVFTFSPLAGDELPQADYVYLPGGYPEFFVRQLSENVKLREQLCEYAENGGRLFAECGGFMYLCRKLIEQDGTPHLMSGVLPLECTLEKMRLHLGYRTARYCGMDLKGHEFHYSSVIKPDILPSEVYQYNVKGIAVDTPLYRYKNVIAGYTHWYWGENDFFKLWE